MLMSARSDLETQASALQANRDRMDAQWAQAENDRRKAEQEVRSDRTVSRV